MHQKESLKNLLDNVEYYLGLLDLKDLKKPVLIKYYLSNYQFFKRKEENAKSDTKKRIYQRQYENFFGLYSFLVNPPHVHTHKIFKP